MKDCLSETCRNNNKGEFSRMKSTRKLTYRNYYLERKDDTGSDDENSIYYINRAHDVNPLKVNINMQPIKFEVDTRSST